MKVRFQNKFLYITAVGSLALTVLVGGLAGLFYAFIFAVCLDQILLNARERK